jgi:heme-degrading monooxygenase HmoA
VISKTPEPPYYAVIFTSVLNKEDQAYGDMATKMEELAKLQSGYLGFESARNRTRISASYWKDLESIQGWKKNSEHLLAQELGINRWYKAYHVRIAKVERDYKF